MPVFSVKCSKCNVLDERLVRDLSISEFSCKDCGSPAKKIINGVSFVAPEGDLTYVVNRERMTKGIYHDDSTSKKKESKEVNADMQEHNAQVMGRLGFTEKQDEYNRADDY